MQVPSTGKIIELLKRKRYTVVAAVSALVIGVLFLVWRANVTKSAASAGNEAVKNASQQSGDEQQDTYVQAFRVKKIAFRDMLKGMTGTVRGLSVELKSSQEERLVKYNFKPGDSLKKGAIIAELDHTRSKARLAQAQIELNRKKKLFAVGGSSRMELQDAEESYKIAKKDYDDTFITAPKNGRLGEILAQEGEIVTRQSPIAYFVSAEDALFVETSIIEKRITSLSGGQKAVVEIDMYPGEKIEGTVLSVSPEVLTTSRMAPVRIALPKAYMKKLRPGLSASCDVLIYDRAALVIPLGCLVEGKEKVFVIDEEKAAHAREVVLGYKSKEYVEVASGLAEGEIVVSNADYAGVAEGSKVRYSEVGEYKEAK